MGCDASAAAKCMPQPAIKCNRLLRKNFSSGNFSAHRLRGFLRPSTNRCRHSGSCHALHPRRASRPFEGDGHCHPDHLSSAPAYGGAIPGLAGKIPGAHAKNLFVKDKKSRLFLISTLEDAALDLKQVHQAIGGQGRVSFGSAELLDEVLGVQPGCVTPLAAINDKGRVTIVLDAALMAHGLLNFHPLVNTSTTSIAAADLLAFLRACGPSR